MQPEGRVDEGGSPTAAEVRQVRALWPWVAGPTWAQKLALAIISLLALGPLVVLVVILRADPTPVRVLVEADATPDATRVTVTALSLAPSSGELRARLLVEPGPDLLRDDGRLERTIALVVNDARGSTERRFDEGTRPDPFEVTLPVAEGSVVRYPVDRYAGSVVVVVVAVDEDGDVPIPASVSARSIIDDFELSGRLVDPDGGDALDQDLGTLTVVDWSASRPATTAVYAVWLMILMWGLAVTGLLIVWAVVIWMVEVPFWAFGYFVGVLFALPPLRDSLPGRPPPGTIFDFVSFYWSVTIIGVNLMLVLAIWLRRTRAQTRLRDLDDATVPAGPPTGP
ncbi:MAG TPA: DUF4436 family protein [Acidimicrobiales bacterium]|nr:DUF4436 family protein [Acidimicrobiales bacterium]